MQKLLLTLFLVAFISPAYAGPGHDHGESAFAGGSGPATHFDLTDQQMNNLGIQSAKVEFLPIAQAVDMLAFTELLPEKKASISPRFGGKIIDIAVAKKYFIKKIDEKDKRKYNLFPSTQVVDEFKEWAKVFKDF